MKIFQQGIVRSFSFPCMALFLLAALAALAALGVGLESQASAQTQRRRPALRRARPAAPAVRRVPRGTQMKIRLDSTIDTKDAREGDTFTATVLTPAKFADATLNGYVSSVKQSGKFKGRSALNLTFSRINYEGGGSAPLSATVVRIYGEDSVSRVDDEGSVKSGSRGDSTTKRTVGGAVIGGILGGLAGGGKGVAIGSVLGGGAGAGSQVIRGSSKVKLENGTEILVRVTN
ncbi:MAG: hypothetical protein WKF84_29150 [Pyrinomonadaceae bacterium]